MASYSRSEARAWAKEHLRGIANVVIPTYTSDLRGLNEAGIRHDIRKEIELGFSGALLVSEVAITLPEYEQFFQWSNDEAKGRLQLIHHASFNTLEENIEATKIAERHGADLALLSYPANFYAENAQQIYDYTKAFCDATDLAVMVFQVPHWGFERVHPSDIEAGLLRRLIDDCPNVAAIKAEGGMPSIMGWVEAHRLFSKEVVVTMPLEQYAIPFAQLVPLQFVGTSDTEYYGPMIPRIFKLVQEGDYDEATRLYWQLQPARKARAAANSYSAQAMFLNRMVWKFEGWLNGFNGGPLRQPTMKINEATMNNLRAGMEKSGLVPTDLPNRDFFIGRNPA
ncbi:dihydrodipicolinate synthase family protein [Nitratireductor soli]|uniref:dihydrodipicolinate synthase family protein n=1 Tax=Nitratireductor soli TaxID=1670619 RepID=UPI00065E6E02|nr:dihydrodipicolinate synthase family protein [Nitratireductor soli]